MNQRIIPTRDGYADVLVQHYASLHEYCSNASYLAKSNRAKYEERTAKKRRRSDKDWFGASPSAAMSMIEDNNIKSALSKRTMLRLKALSLYFKTKLKLAPINVIDAKRRKRGSEGSEYDIHAALSGNIDQAWESKIIRKTEAPVYTLALNTGIRAHEIGLYTCSIPAAFSMAIAKQAKISGHAVGVIYYKATLEPFESTTMNYCASIPVISQGGEVFPLNFAKVSIAAMNRIYGFCALESVNGYKVSPNAGFSTNMHNLGKHIEQDFCNVHGPCLMLPKIEDEDIGYWLQKTRDLLQKYVALDASSKMESDLRRICQEYA